MEGKGREGKLSPFGTAKTLLVPLTRVLHGKNHNPFPCMTWFSELGSLNIS